MPGGRPNAPVVTGLTVSDGKSPPGAPAPFPKDGSLNGNFGVPRMEGEGIPGDSIVVRCGDEQWDCIVDSDGTWHVELGELDNGEYEFEVQEINPKTGKVSDATEATLDNETSNADRQWQREGAKDRIAKDGRQSYGPARRRRPAAGPARVAAVRSPMRAAAPRAVGRVVAASPPTAAWAPTPAGASHPTAAPAPRAARVPRTSARPRSRSPGSRRATPRPR